MTCHFAIKVSLLILVRFELSWLRVKPMDGFSIYTKSIHG